MAAAASDSLEAVDPNAALTIPEQIGLAVEGAGLFDSPAGQFAAYLAVGHEFRRAGFIANQAERSIRSGQPVATPRRRSN